MKWIVSSTAMGNTAGANPGNKSIPTRELTNITNSTATSTHTLTWGEWSGVPATSSQIVCAGTPVDVTVNVCPLPIMLDPDRYVIVAM